MRRVFSLLLILFFTATLFPAVPAQVALAKTPDQVQNYAIFYGTPDPARIEQLKKFDLVIVMPDNFTVEQVQAIKAAGTIVLGYMPTLVVTQDKPEFSGLLPQDYLTVNGQRLGTTWGNTPMAFLDPRSTHVWEVIKEAIRTKVYSKGFDGVFLDGLNVPSEFLNFYVSMDQTALRNLQIELYSRTTDLVYQIKAIDRSKYIGQNNGWRELKDYTGPYLNFLAWSDYPAELGTTDQWVMQKRGEVLAFKEKYGVVPLAYRSINPADSAAMASFYSAVREQGLIPYAVPGTAAEINTYGLPAVSTTPVPAPAPAPTPAPTTGQTTGGGTVSRLPHDVNSFVIHWGDPTPQQLEDMKKFDMAIVDPSISDAKVKELQAAGVIVIAYVPTTSIDQQYPYFQGLIEEDFLHVNGQRVANNNDIAPDWLMDPRSAHYRQVVVNTIKKNIFDRGFDGVFLDTLNQVAEYLEFYVSLDPTTLQTMKKELMAASAQLAAEIRAAGPNKIIAQNNGWRELVNYTAPYIDFLMWEEYPYELGTSDAWLNAKRDNLIRLRDQYNFKVLATRFFRTNDYAGVEKFYTAARAYGFIPYAPWTDGPLYYNTVNTYLVPPRSPVTTIQSAVEPALTPAPEPAPAVEPAPTPTPEPAPADRESPTVPTGLTVWRMGRLVTLTWQPATDNVGVDHYIVYRSTAGGKFVEYAVVKGTLFVELLKPKQTCTYYVVAVDKAGNRSPASVKVTITAK